EVRCRRCVVGHCRGGDRVGAAVGAAVGEVLGAGVGEVGIAVRVGRRDGDRLGGTRGLAAGAGDDQASCGGGGDGDREPVGTRGGECAVGDGDVGGLDVVQLHRAHAAGGIGDAAGERIGGGRPEVGRRGCVVR